MKQFNDAQQEAISVGQGPAMVLAGPGSGKTLVITWRVRQLIEHMGVNPSNILVITFTRAAAEEMKKRFCRFPGMERMPVTFGTLHSVFFMILRQAYHYQAGHIIKEEVKRNYIKSCIQSLDLEMEDENEFISGVIGEISYVKGEMIRLEYFHSSYCSDEMFAGIYRAYDNQLRKEGLIDFDDILVFCYELLKERQDIRRIWQKKFRYILIDEFQDINRIQYEIVRLLTGEDRNLFVVGDDDQSIYRFRGARPEIMLGFEKDYPGAKKVVLDINYRCSQDIVEGATNLIVNNKKRFQKELKAFQGKKEPIRTGLFDHVAQESDRIVRDIRQYHRQGTAYEEMAVIFRTGTQPGQLVTRLMEANIPFTMRDRIPYLFDHWIARDMIAYMKLAMGDRSRDLVLQVMNRPKRYISRQMIHGPQVDFNELKKETFGKKWLYDKIDQFEMHLFMLRKMEPYAAIRFIRSGIGYDEYIGEYAGFRHIDPQPLFDIIDQVQDNAREYHSYEEWFSRIDRTREELKRQAQTRSRQEGVTLTTMHSAKGLEFEAVFVMDCNEGVTPHKKAVKDADLEEERRLFYVAMTRAKTWLHLYSVKEMYQKQVEVSPYIGEVRFRRDRYEEGARIRHKTLGAGTVEKMMDDKICIVFDQGGRSRTFSLPYLMMHDLIRPL